MQMLFSENIATTIEQVLHAEKQPYPIQTQKLPLERKNLNFLLKPKYAKNLSIYHKALF